MCSVDAPTGPWAAAVSEWISDPKEKLAVAVFRVQTSGVGGSRMVLRRYSEFAALAHELRHAKRTPPAMPPGSFFRKRLQPGFLERRRQGLDAFLSAVVVADPHCVGAPALRAFLGLPEVEDCFGESMCLSTDDEVCSADDDGANSEASLVSERGLFTIVEEEWEDFRS